jgi:hypothetical protein
MFSDKIIGIYLLLAIATFYLVGDLFVEKRATYEFDECIDYVCNCNWFDFVIILSGVCWCLSGVFLVLFRLVKKFELSHTIESIVVVFGLLVFLSGAVMWVVLASKAWDNFADLCSNKNDLPRFWVYTSDMLAAILYFTDALIVMCYGMCGEPDFEQFGIMIDIES